MTAPLQGPQKKALITIQLRLLARIDRAAQLQGRSRSDLVRELLAHYADYFERGTCESCLVKSTVQVPPYMQAMVEGKAPSEQHAL
jgi:Ribbon-helix-helix protein, copG family